MRFISPKKAISFLKRERRLPSLDEVLIAMDIISVRRERPKLPKFIQLEPTTRCNFNCVTCTRKKLNPSRLSRDLTLEDFKIVIKQISPREVKLQGMGEPFLNKNLHEILEEGRYKRISFTTITNGSLLHKYLDLIPYFDSITVSIDSVDEYRFKQIRIGDSLNRIISNLELVVQEIRLNKWGTKIGINSVISHLNYDEIPKLIELAFRLNLDFISIVEVENWKTPLEKDYDEERKFIEKAREKSREIRELIESVRGKYPNIKIYYLPSTKRKQTCTWSFTATFITVDGFVTPCCIRMDPEVINFGNIFEDDFKSIWYSDKYIKFRRSLIENSPNPICDNCPD
jgi:radical SAM protein with 4Fe4S-binding SPASM domain